jgi:hypothetical protein
MGNRNEASRGPMHCRHRAGMACIMRIASSIDTVASMAANGTLLTQLLIT